MICSIAPSKLSMIILPAPGLDRQRVDPLVHQLAQGGIDHALALDPRLAGEGGAFDAQAEMALAGGIIAAVPAVLLAVVVQLQYLGRERVGQAAGDLRRYRASGG